MNIVKLARGRDLLDDDALAGAGTDCSGAFAMGWVICYADEDRYADIIRRHLLTSDGQPSATQRSLRDHGKT